MRIVAPEILVVLMIFTGCAELKKLQLPPLPDTEFKSSKVERQGSRGKPIGCFGYYATWDSLVKASHVDSTLTLGIFVPSSSIELSAAERRMSFGNELRQCRVHYVELNIQHASEYFSMLDEILFPRSAPVHYQQHTDYTTMRRLLNGIIFDSLACDTIRFYFEQTGTDYGIDTTIINGYFRCSSDSFFLQPSFKKIDIHGKNTRDMYLLQGYSLKKENDLIAFLLHAPNFKSGPDLLYLRRDLPESLQMQLSAYFSLISRMVKADEGTRIF